MVNLNYNDWLSAMRKSIGKWQKDENWTRWWWAFRYDFSPLIQFYIFVRRPDNTGQNDQKVIAGYWETTSAGKQNYDMWFLINDPDSPEGIYKAIARSIGFKD